MNSIRYKPLSELLEKFKEFEEPLTEEFQNSDISWGSEKQLTLASAPYIQDIIEEYLQQQLDDAREEGGTAVIAMYEGALRTLERERQGPALYYCMEE